LRTLDNTTNADSTYCLRKINPNIDSRMTHQPPYPFIHHSFNKVPNRPYGITSGERNGTTPVRGRVASRRHAQRRQSGRRLDLHGSGESGRELLPGGRAIRVFNASSRITSC
jgi:hypothetical protein